MLSPGQTQSYWTYFACWSLIQWPPGRSNFKAYSGILPAKYSLCTLQSCMYIDNYRAFTCYASYFIYMYWVFSCTSIIVIIIYMYVPCICPYINRCNHNMFFLSSFCSSGLLFTNFKILINLASAHFNPTN